jgi:hypothetical protein
MLLATSAARAHEIPFETPTQFLVSGGKLSERPLALIFDDSDMFVRHRDTREILLRFDYSTVTKLTYEEVVVPKVLASSKVATDSLKEKRRWLTIEYTQDGKSAYLLLALDNSDWEDVVGMAGGVTEKDVEGAPEQ